MANPLATSGILYLWLNLLIMNAHRMSVMGFIARWPGGRSTRSYDFKVIYCSLFLLCYFTKSLIMHVQSIAASFLDDVFSEFIVFFFVFSLPIMNQVQTTKIEKLCNTWDIVTINGMFPGPVIYAQEDDRVIVRVTNETPYNATIHW